MRIPNLGRSALLVLFSWFSCAQFSSAQDANLNSMLNQIDQPSDWQAPASQAQAAPRQFGMQGAAQQSQQFGTQGAPQQYPQQQFGMQNAQQQQFPQQQFGMQNAQTQQFPQQQQQFGMQSPQQFPQQQQFGMQNQQQFPQQQPQGYIAGQYGQQQGFTPQQSATNWNAQSAPRQNPWTLQNIFKTMMGGGATQTGTKKDYSGDIGTAQENLQQARDQEQQAIDSANNVSGQSDKGAKQNLASEARYHANAAREASDRVYSAAGSTNNSTIQGLASEARAAADEANAAADRAYASANGGGW